MISSNAAAKAVRLSTWLCARSAAARERVLGQHALAERVDRRDRRDVQRAQRGGQSLPRGRVDGPQVRVRRLFGRELGAQHRLDQRPDPAHQLVGGAVGERHDQHLVDARVAADQAIDHEVLDEIGLAGAG
jgi:hypothetical protein